ncbi:MAG: hypothetical protein J6S00_03605 [Clostridia bacterium]|nr:hypothetical protein [Clostridia bacterium]
MFWNKTITLYNKYQDEQTGIIKWYKHTLRDCFIKVTNNKVNVGGVQLQTDDNIIRIPKQPNYLPPYEWLKLPNDIKSQSLTLQTGDLIFLGDIDEIIDEYTSGLRSSDLIAKYKSMGSMFVNSVNINDFIQGEHYFVRGE